MQLHQQRTKVNELLFFFLATLRNIAIQTKCSCRCSCPLPNEINFTAIIVPQPTPPPKHGAWLVIVLLASKLSYTHQWRMLTICIYISERRDKFLNEINLTVIIVTLHPPKTKTLRMTGYRTPRVQVIVRALMATVTESNMYLLAGNG